MLVDAVRGPSEAAKWKIPAGDRWKGLQYCNGIK